MIARRRRRVFKQLMANFLFIGLIMCTGACDKNEEIIQDKIPQNIQYNTDLLKLLLTRAPNDRVLCTYVKNETSFSPLDTYSNQSICRLGTFLDQNLKIPEYSITPLLFELFLLNRFSTVINFESQRELGYVILPDDSPPEKAKTKQTRWTSFYEKHSDADGGITYASIPVIDKANGIIAWYKLVIGGPLSGEGSIIVYQMGQDGTIKELVKWGVIRS